MARRARSTRPAAFLAVGTILALATLGIGSAAWTDTLHVSGTVETAEFRVTWLESPVFCGDSDGTSAPDDLAQTTARRDKDALHPAGDDQLILLAITNGYPGYQAFCSFQWRNDSTIPVLSTDLRIATPDNPATAGGVVVANGVPTDFDLDGDAVNDVTITFSGGSNFPIPPGPGLPDTITVTILSGAPQGATLRFTGQHNFVQGIP